MDRFEASVARLLTSKVPTENSEISRIREHAGCLTELGRELCRRLNMASDVDLRLGFANIRLLTDPTVDAVVISDDATTPEPKKGQFNVVSRSGPPGPSRASRIPRMSTGTLPRRRGKKEVVSYRGLGANSGASISKSDLKGKISEATKKVLARKNAIKASTNATISTNLSATVSASAGFQFEPITPPSPNILTVSRNPVGRAIGMCSRTLFKQPERPERPERPRPPSPLVVTVPVSPCQVFTHI